MKPEILGLKQKKPRYKKKRIIHRKSVKEVERLYFKEKNLDYFLKSGEVFRYLFEEVNTEEMGMPFIYNEVLNKFKEETDKGHAIVFLEPNFHPFEIVEFGKIIPLTDRNYQERKDIYPYWVLQKGGWLNSRGLSFESFEQMTNWVLNKADLVNLLGARFLF